MRNSIFGEFKITQGSKIWPSDDPNDSPFDKFRCNHCYTSLSIQMGGSCYVDMPSFEERAKQELREHLLNHCSDLFLKEHTTVDMLTAGPAFDILLLRELHRKGV